jgi:hypothetical protein
MIRCLMSEAPGSIPVENWIVQSIIFIACVVKTKTLLLVDGCAFWAAVGDSQVVLNTQV